MVLSFTLPFPIITLIVFTRDPALMVRLVNRPTTTAVASLCAVLIVALNVVLLYETLVGLPGGM